MKSKKTDSRVVIHIIKNFKHVNFSLSKLKKLIRNICERFGLSGAIISIVLVNNVKIRSINRKFLSHNRITDVISFDLSDNYKQSSTKLFELVVNAERAVKEAGLRGLSSEAELALYVTHGLLHNLGFSDSSKTEAKEMHAMEDQILQQSSYGIVYNRTLLPRLGRGKKTQTC